MLPYLLRVWTGLNPYPEDSDIYKRLEKFVVTYKFDQSPAFEILSLDGVKYFDPWVNDVENSDTVQSR